MITVRKISKTKLDIQIKSLKHSLPCARDLLHTSSLETLVPLPYLSRCFFWLGVWRELLRVWNASLECELLNVRIQVHGQQTAACQSGCTNEKRIATNHVAGMRLLFWGMCFLYFSFFCGLVFTWQNVLKVITHTHTDTTVTIKNQITRITY